MSLGTWSANGYFEFMIVLLEPAYFSEPVDFFFHSLSQQFWHTWNVGLQAFRFSSFKELFHQHI